MIDKKQAIKEIQVLIKKYEDLPKTRLKTISEADTRRMFIIPLFRALGWDVDNIETDNEVIEEETSISGRIDYSFRLNNITQFVVEAKGIPEDLDREKWARQAIEYGWNKGIPWVVLTDFEGLKVFNSEWKKENPQPNVDLTCKDYIEKFDRLWLLSKESIQKGELDKRAGEWGITAKRESVNKHLAKDLLGWRGLLTDYFTKWNEKIDTKDIEEAVQRILDRLIFMRVVEDRELEEKKLWQAYKKWGESGYEPQNFIESLVPIFRKFDKKYNSNLFVKHLCEDLYTTQEPFKEILPALYGSKEQGVKYRFDAIDADVLGNVYEQYLGHVQGREGGKSKRKKQGIYYTPAYIVDYIVENTLGKLLEEKSLREIEKIKVLDPACGSGSFLIKAFDVLNEKIKKERGGKEGIQAALKKYRILTESIYGVDLDPQAVEIARLNLLLKALEPNHKLPMLNENIKNGNSLIDDKKFTDKPFNWKEELLGIFKDGGFDVVIGNPPYIFARGGNFPEKIKQYYYNKFPLSNYQLNTYLLFIDQSFRLLKEDGYLGFIIPNTWLTIDTFSPLRKFLLEKTTDLQIINIHDQVFKASVDTCLLLFRKGTPEKVILGEFRDGSLKVVGKFLPDTFKSNNYIINISLAKSQDKMTVLKKVDGRSRHLDSFSTVKAGLKAYETGKGMPPQTDEMKNNRVYHSKEKEDGTYVKYLEGRDVTRYYLDWGGWFLKYGECLAAPRKKELFTEPRILVRQIPSSPPHSINAIYTEEFLLNDINSMIIYNFQNLSPLFVLAILNSKLTTFWFVNTFDKFQRKTFPQFKVKELAVFPIPETSKKNQAEIVKLAQLILDLQKELQKVTENTDKHKSLKTEIEKIDQKIDQEVYKLYNLTPEEIEIVEKS